DRSTAISSNATAFSVLIEFPFCGLLPRGPAAILDLTSAVPAFGGCFPSWPSFPRSFLPEHPLAFVSRIQSPFHEDRIARHPETEYPEDEPGEQKTRHRRLR